MTRKDYDRPTRYPHAGRVARFICAVVDITTEGRKPEYLASRLCNDKEFLERLHADDPAAIATYHAVHAIIGPKAIVPYRDAPRNFAPEATLH